VAGALVGVLSENVFGFVAGGAGGACSAAGGDEAGGSANAAGAAALGISLAWVAIVPFALCLSCYTAMHWTYGRDRIDEAGGGKRVVEQL
jgi:hypothetical protein